MLFRILAVGDVVGNPGLDFAARNLRRIKKELGADFAVVNGENANVVGVTPKQCDALLAAGADAVTLGYHTWTRLGAPALPGREPSGPASRKLCAPVSGQGLCQLPDPLRSAAGHKPAGPLHA